MGRKFFPAPPLLIARSVWAVKLEACSLSIPLSHVLAITHPDCEPPSYDRQLRLHFSHTTSGYTFDFAAQTISPPNITFQEAAQPSSNQLAEVSAIAETALDRIYSYAQGEFHT